MNDIIDRELVRRVVQSAGGQGRPNWSHVADRFCVGSGVAAALCRRFNVDPDEVVGRPGGEDE